jgi:RHS repeat-associated protein
MSDSTGNNFPSGMRYDAYGSRSATDGSDYHPSDFQWAGGWGYQKEFSDWTEPGIGLTYIQNRYYDSHAGRFMSLDPIRFAGGLNLYNYCESDPVNLIDPDGERGRQDGPMATGTASLVSVVRPIGRDRRPGYEISSIARLGYLLTLAAQESGHGVPIRTGHCPLTRCSSFEVGRIWNVCLAKI